MTSDVTTALLTTLTASERIRSFAKMARSTLRTKLQRNESYRSFSKNGLLQTFLKNLITG